MPKFSPKYRSNPIRVKTMFASAVLRQTAEEIRKRQTQVAKDWNLFDQGNLKAWLQGHFAVANQEGRARLSMRYLAYARWLDMQDPRRKLKKEGYHLYNRIVFGILYNRTLPALKYGFTDNIKMSIDQQLAQIAETNVNAAAIISKSLRTGYF